MYSYIHFTCGSVIVTRIHDEKCLAFKSISHTTDFFALFSLFYVLSILCKIYLVFFLRLSFTATAVDKCRLLGRLYTNKIKYRISTSLFLFNTYAASVHFNRCPLHISRLRFRFLYSFYYNFNGQYSKR